MIEIVCQSQFETETVAATLAARACAGDLFALEGDLGAGKSTFARAFIRAALEDANAQVPSPTFTLVQSYAANPEIYHADLYRIHDPDEVFELGLDEVRDSAVLLVEWPDRMPQEWQHSALFIHFAHTYEAAGTAREGERRLRFVGNSERWQQLLKGLV